MEFFSLTSWTAFEQFAGELSGATEAGNVPFIGWNQRPLWKYPGDCRFPARVPTKSGRSIGCWATFRCHRPALPVQSKSMIWLNYFLLWGLLFNKYKFVCSIHFRQNVLFAIGSAFLHHANHFKLYSSFCASHSKAQKVLLPSKYSQLLQFIYLFVFFIVFAALIFNDINSTDEGSQALQEFLQSRNPRQQHSSTLESYLIKPIQRILKYPLLLQQLRNLTDSNSSEHQHLVGTFLT